MIFGLQLGAKLLFVQSVNNLSLFCTLIFNSNTPQSFQHTACLKLKGHYHSNELLHDKTNTMTCVPSEDSDQPEHSPSLIKVFAVRSLGSLGPKVSSCGRQRLCLSLHWVHRAFCWFCRAVAQIILFIIILHNAKNRRKCYLYRYSLFLSIIKTPY